jgi:transposase
MENSINALPNVPELLKKLLLEVSIKSADFEEVNRLAQNKQFGKSSEVCPDQGDLLNEVEHVSDEEKKGDIELENSKPANPKCKKSTRSKLPMDTLRKTIIVDLRDDENQCDCCGHELHKMGEDKFEKHEFILKQVKVVESIRFKYSCQNCEKISTKVVIKQVSFPSLIIPKSFATLVLLSQIITSKYKYSLSLYRQEAKFKQYGITLSWQTMSNWTLKYSEILKLLNQSLHQKSLKQNFIHTDETTVIVLASGKLKCYMWS